MATNSSRGGSSFINRVRTFRRNARAVIRTAKELMVDIAVALLAVWAVYHQVVLSAAGNVTA